MEPDVWINIAKYTAYVLTVIAFVLCKAVSIRIVFIAACVAGIVFVNSQSYHDKWIDISWLSLLIALNVYQIIRFYYENVWLCFRNENEKAIYSIAFRHFSRKQFKQLMDIGKFGAASIGENLITQGEPVNDLFMLCNGQAAVSLNNSIIAYCHPGKLIGETSYFTNSPANANVIIVEPATFIKWPQAELKKLLESDPELKKSMQAVFSIDFFRKHKLNDLV